MKSNNNRIKFGEIVLIIFLNTWTLTFKDRLYNTTCCAPVIHHLTPDDGMNVDVVVFDCV